MQCICQHCPTQIRVKIVPWFLYLDFTKFVSKDVSLAIFIKSTLNISKFIKTMLQPTMLL